MTELKQNQLITLAGTLNAVCLKTPSDSDKVSEKVDCIAYCAGTYGVSGKLWRGRETGNFYYATRYNSNLYRF